VAKKHVHFALVRHVRDFLAMAMSSSVVSPGAEPRPHLVAFFPGRLDALRDFPHLDASATDDPPVFFGTINAIKLPSETS